MSRVFGYNHLSVFILPSFKPRVLSLRILAGPAPHGEGPQHAAALAPDLLVAGVTVLVPALTPPDRWVSCL